MTVTFTDNAGNPETLPSAPTAAVESEAGPLTGFTLVNAAVTHYVIYRGELQNGSMNGRPMTRYATIEATGEEMSYTDDEAQAGAEYRYRVAAVNGAGEGKKSNWINIEA